MSDTNNIQREKPTHPILNALFSIEKLEHIAFEPLHVFKEDYNQIFLTEHGAGEIVIDGEEVSLANNTVLLLSHGQVYSFKENRITGYLLKFDNSFWRKTPESANNCKAVLFDHEAVKHQLNLDPMEMDKIIPYFDAAWEEYCLPDYSNKPDVLAAYLKIIVIKIANIHFLLQKDIGNYDNRLYQDFIGLIHQEGHNIHDVASFAERLGVTARKLSDTCNKFGIGAKEMISNQLIAEAKRSLQFTGKAIKEISGDLNFSTPYQFSHFFKKHTKLSPLEYKRQFVEIGI